MFKAREDGGFDCVTEIIAQGETLESLKAQTKLVPKMMGLGNFEFINHIEMFFAIQKQNSIGKEINKYEKQ